MMSRDLMQSRFTAICQVLVAGVTVAAASLSIWWGIATVMLFIALYTLLKLLAMELVLFCAQVARHESTSLHSNGEV